MNNSKRASAKATRNEPQAMPEFESIANFSCAFRVQFLIVNCEEGNSMKFTV